MPVINSAFTCPITRDAIEYPVLTNCSHMFEQDSLKQWINTQQAEDAQATPSCPCCREPLEVEKIIIGTRIDPREEEPDFIPMLNQQPNIFTENQNLENNLADDFQEIYDLPEETSQTATPWSEINPLMMFSSMARTIQHGAGLIDTLVNHTPPAQDYTQEFGGGFIGMIFSNLYATFTNAFKVCCGMAEFMNNDLPANQPTRNLRNINR